MFWFVQFCSGVHQALQSSAPWIFHAAVLMMVAGCGCSRRELAWYVRMPWFKQVVVTGVFATFVHAVVSKPDGGGAGDPSGPLRMMMRQLASAPESSAVYAGLFPPWTNAVTNVCVTGFKLTDTSVVSRVHHPADVLVKTGRAS